MSVCIKDLCCRPYVYNHLFSLFEQNKEFINWGNGRMFDIYYRVTLTVKWQDRSCLFSFIFFSVKNKGGPVLKVGQLDREHL